MNKIENFELQLCSTGLSGRHSERGRRPFCVDIRALPSMVLLTFRT
jgi:hypothetical protein